MADSHDSTTLELRQAQTQLNALWEEHAADPGQQALVCARYCLETAPHLAEGLKARIYASLPDAVMIQLLFKQPDDGRIQALNLLTRSDPPAAPLKQQALPEPRPELNYTPKYSPEKLSTEQNSLEAENLPEVTVGGSLLRADPELGRLAISFNQAHLYRLWVVVRQIVRDEDGSGRVAKAELKRRLADYGIHYSERQIRRMLRAGEGVFWRQDRRQRQFIYLAGWQRLGADLAQRADLCLGHNKPGASQQLVDVSGGLEQWEARLYASWIAYRDQEGGLSISRDRLAELFGRTPKTIRKWEADRLGGEVAKRFDYEQHPDDARSHDELYALRGHVPEHAIAYTVKTPAGPAHRRVWQRVNTYTSSTEAHPHRGQARKVRRAVNSAISADTDGGPWRMYYTLEEHRKRLKSRRFRMGQDGDVNRLVHVLIGENQGRGVWELMTADPSHPYPLTSAEELVMKARKADIFVTL